jgi:hypothetical protein
VLDYPKLLEGWNTSAWSGWKRIPQPDGAVAYLSDNVDNYSLVGPATAAATTGGGTSSSAIIGIVVAVVVVAGIAIAVVARRRHRTVEED